MEDSPIQFPTKVTCNFEAQNKSKLLIFVIVFKEHNIKNI